MGASRQHNGRRGKVDNCQVGVFLSYAHNGYHTWVDGEVFIPENWFTEAAAPRRQKAGIPPDRHFQTKPELGWQMTQRVVRVDRVRHESDMLWQTVTLRPSERGYLRADFAHRRVWTVRDDLTVMAKWLLIRRDGNHQTYTLSNAPADIVSRGCLFSC